MTPQPWADPALTSRGRLPMHAVPHDDRLPLDGRWRFQLLHRPDEAPGEAWGEADVPGCWTMQDTWDRPIYTNVQMPFPNRPPETPEENPTGVYERSFEVPARWAGKRVVLHVGAAESVLLVEVNGQDVGISKDSHLAAEFEVTDLLRPGANELRLTVVKWSDASFIEDQDQWWHGGITRPVFLYATGSTYLADLVVDAGLTADGTTGTLSLEVGLGWAGTRPDAGLAGRGRGRGRTGGDGRRRAARPATARHTGGLVRPRAAAAGRRRPPEPQRRRRADRTGRRRPLARGRARRPPHPGRPGAPGDRGGGRPPVVGGGAVAVPAGGPPRRARRHRRRAGRAPDRVPAGGGPGRRAARQRARRPAPRREPPRLRPADRAGGRARGHARRRRRDEALGLQRRPVVALPERPGLPRRLRRARAVRHRRGGHRVARLVRGRVPGPPLPVGVRRPRGADDRARPPPPLDHRLVAGQRVRLRAEPRRGRRLGARRRPVAAPALRGRDQVRLVVGGDRERPAVPDVPADRLAGGPRALGGAAAPAGDVRVQPRDGQQQRDPGRVLGRDRVDARAPGRLHLGVARPRPRATAPGRDHPPRLRRRLRRHAKRRRVLHRRHHVPRPEPEAGHLRAHVPRLPRPRVVGRGGDRGRARGPGHAREPGRVPRHRVAPGGLGGLGRRRFRGVRRPAAARDRAGRHRRGRDPGLPPPGRRRRRALADAALPHGRGRRLGGGRPRDRLGAGAAGRRGHPTPHPAPRVPHHTRAGPATSRSTTRGTSSTPRSRRRRSCPSGAPRRTTTGSAGWRPAGRAGGCPR